MFWPFRRRKHQADEYFRYKWKHERPETKEGWNILMEAQRIRHQYPELSGPELVRLVYWGASGSPEPA